jgi:hypothetical protein
VDAYEHLSFVSEGLFLLESDVCGYSLIHKFFNGVHIKSFKDVMSILTIVSKVTRYLHVVNGHKSMLT